MSTATVDTLHESLVAALSELGEIVADETADTGTYKYKYAPLSTIMRTVRPVLGRHGLVVSQLISSTNSQLVVSTSLVHRSGQTFQSGMLAVELPRTPQQLGSLVSYLRRYQLVALLGVAVEDDDASSAAQRPRPVERTRGTSGGRPARVAVLSEQQRRKIMALFGELGMSGADRRDDRLSLTSDIIGRDIDTTNDVTPTEAGVLIEELSNRADELLHMGDEP